MDEQAISALASRSDEELASAWKEVGLDVPRELVDESLRRGERLVPWLGPMIALPDLWSMESEKGYGASHALMLLCAIGSPAATPYVADFLRRGLGGDWLTEDGDALVLSLGPTATDAIWAVARNEQADEWGRVMAIKGITAIAMSHDSARPDIVVRFRELLSHAMGKFPETYAPADDNIVTYLCASLAELHDEPSRDNILRAYDKGMCEEFVCNKEDIEDLFSAPFGTRSRHRRNPLDHFLPKNLAYLKRLAEDARRWRARQTAKSEEYADRLISGDDAGFKIALDSIGDTPVVDDDSASDAPSAPLAHEEKIGRNAPCPCGSGKKYKKCCLSKHQP